MVLVWSPFCVGMFFVLYWYVFGMILVWCWYGFVIVLVWFWYGVGMVLVCSWYSSGMVWSVLVWFLYMVLVRFGMVLIRF